MTKKPVLSPLVSGDVKRTTFTDRNTLVLDHLYLAEHFAKSKKRKLSHVSYDELQSAAYLGLVEAAKSYIPEKNNCFAAFAVWRIIGAVRDYLRELSWGVRSNPLKMSCLNNQLEIVYQNNSKTIDLEFFENLLVQLPQSNKVVMRLYYLEFKKITEIAVVLGVHKSRVSQILTDSKARLHQHI